MLSEPDAIALVAKEDLRLRIVGYGIACRIGRDVIINKNLLRYREYALEVLDHEVRHSDGFSKKDLFMDLFEGNFWDNLKFTVRHPSALTHFIPFGKYNGAWFIDLNMIITYAFALVCVLVWYFVVMGLILQ